MDKFFSLKRNIVQALATILTNIHLPNFLSGIIHTGKSKILCVPGLNCYSCPGAAGACPIGAFQAVVGSSKFRFSYYITGILILFGVLAGRLICGLLCPFGFFQDLVHKLPGRKFSTKRLGFLRYLKYIILVVVVWLMGVFIVGKSGLSVPYFCKYICPQGILEGAIPLSIANPSIRQVLGKLFGFKSLVLITTIVLSILFYRPFCKWICPLGAFYSLFNKVSFFQFKLDHDKCISCGKCRKVCKMDVDIAQCQDSLECIRCGDCMNVCPTKAISTNLPKIKKDEKGISYEKNK